MINVLGITFAYTSMQYTSKKYLKAKAYISVMKTKYD